MKTIKYWHIALALSALAISAHAALTDFSPGLIEWVKSRWGVRGVARVMDWQHQQAAASLASPLQGSEGASTQLDQINSFFNRVPYSTPKRYWGGENYWATPVEMLGSNSAFCVHYATSKYLSLKDLQIPVERLRITYVRAKQQSEWHMVLAYYPTPDADPLILDNLTGDIRPASQRPDLTPIYSFNDDDMWVANTLRKGGSLQVRQWRALLEKLHAETKL